MGKQKQEWLEQGSKSMEARGWVTSIQVARGHVATGLPCGKMSQEAKREFFVLRRYIIDAVGVKKLHIY